jgi:TolA-binding protein
MNAGAATLDIYRKIDREKAIIHAANHIRHATSNASVNAQVESQIRDARRNIEYFQQTLQELETRKMDEDLNVLAIQNVENKRPPSQGHKDSSGFGGNTEKGLVVSEYDSRDVGGARETLPHTASYTAPGLENRLPYPNYSGLGK